MENLTNFIGKTIKLENPNSTGEVGNKIQGLFGVMANNSNKADLGFWELKSINVDSKSSISLGRKAQGTDADLIDTVSSKIKNTICFTYKVENMVATILSIEILVGLNKDLFSREFGKKIIFEKKRRNLRCYPNNLKLFYNRVTTISL